MSKFFFIILLLLVLIFYSCDDKSNQKENFKDIEYNINLIIYNKNYEKAIKYIDSIFFTKKAVLSKEDKLKLLFTTSEIKYLYLNDTRDAYKEMKIIFKDKSLDSFKNKELYTKLLKYLVEISQKIDPQNFSIFLAKYLKINPNKILLYRYLNLLKKEKNIKKLEYLIKNNKLLSNQELILLKLDVLIMKKVPRDSILKFINDSIKKTKKIWCVDDLNVRKLFIMEQNKKVDYSDLLKILNSIKSKKYSKLKKDKEKFYKNKILLYNKK